MDIKKTLTDMKNTNSEKYKKRLAASSVMKLICTFILFPLTLVCFIGGGFYTAIDAVVIERQAQTAGYPGKSRSSRQNCAGETAKRLESAPVQEGTETAEKEPPDDEELMLHLYDFDRSAVPEGKYGVIPLSMYKPISDDSVPVKNSSGLKIDYRDYIDRDIDLSVRCDGEYEALIIHTHGTEAYTPEGVFYVDAGFYPRSDEKSENVVGIGDVFERVFNEAGIKTLHCEVPIDKASYSKAYGNAAKLIKGFIAEYPSIKYVFDVHRDSVSMDSGEKVRAVTAVNGKIAAQVMFVIGTDAITAANSNWGDNFAFALKLQLALDRKYRNFVRPVNLKQGAYNQFYTPLSLLIEVGCDGNTFAEAEYSAELTADCIVHILKGE